MNKLKFDSLRHFFGITKNKRPLIPCGRYLDQKKVCEHGNLCNYCDYILRLEKLVDITEDMRD